MRFETVTVPTVPNGSATVPGTACSSHGSHNPHGSRPLGREPYFGNREPISGTVRKAPHGSQNETSPDSQNYMTKIGIVSDIEQLTFSTTHCGCGCGSPAAVSGHFLAGLRRSRRFRRGAGRTGELPPERKSVSVSILEALGAQETRDLRDVPLVAEYGVSIDLEEE